MLAFDFCSSIAASLISSSPLPWGPAATALTSHSQESYPSNRGIYVHGKRFEEEEVDHEC